MKLLYFSILSLFSLCNAHVRLDFPPSHVQNYDFLDNVRTEGPCGTKATENSPVTTFAAGSTFQVSFRLAYAHRGGLGVRLLNSNGSIAQILLPRDGNATYLVNQDDGTIQTVSVTLPNGFMCEQCTLQLIRNAGEWALGNGQPYLFWSCAEVSIVETPSTNCPNNCGVGTCEGSTCTCPRLYYGDYCQFKNECEDGTECKGQGMCVDTQSTNMPRKQCFCLPGYHGPRCEFSGQLRSADLEIVESRYTIKREFNNMLTVYARIDNGHLEVAMELQGMGWVALGVRSANADTSCYRNSPAFHPINASNQFDHSIVISLPAISVGSVSEEGGSNEEGSSEEATTEEGSSEEVANEEGSNEEGSNEEGSNEEGSNEEGSNEEGSNEEGGAGEGNGGGLHAMDCTDIVIVGARGFTHRVRDYYTRDRSSPQEDEVYGGQYSLTDAIAREQDGVTRAIFRRKLQTTDRADHSIVDGAMTVIWAFGQVQGDFFHSPASSLEAGQASNRAFYQPDEIKYHGSRTRGQTQINFFTADQPTNEDGCYGSYMDPGCTSPQSCDYRAEWIVTGDHVRVRVIAKVNINSWAAIGFSTDTVMPETDVVLGASDGSRSFIHDRYALARAEPPIDPRQNIMNASAVRVDGFTVLDFVRPLQTDDLTRDVSLTECVFFFFGYNGPVRDYDNGGVGYHRIGPLSSPNRICLSTQCPSLAPKFNITSLDLGVTGTDPTGANPPSQVDSAAVLALRREQFVLYVAVGILSALVLALLFALALVGVCCACGRRGVHDFNRAPLSEQELQSKISADSEDVKSGAANNLYT